MLMMFCNWLCAISGRAVVLPCCCTGIYWTSGPEPRSNWKLEMKLDSFAEMHLPPPKGRDSFSSGGSW